MFCKSARNIEIAYILYFLAVLTIGSQCSYPAICNKTCSGIISNSSEVEVFCNEHVEEGYHLHGRCCLNNDSVTGLDLSGCKLQNVTDLFVNMSSLTVLILKDNPIKHINGLDLRGAINLKILSIPLELSCPGGPSAWDGHVNHTDSRWCTGELNTCLSIDNCPANTSYCVHVAPGSSECWCLANHHGYKCLRTDYFPTDIFLGSLGGATVALAIFLWFTERRFVKKYT